MLANNFKPAVDLGISDDALEALIKVLGMLERGEIGADKFNMMFIGNPECGTPGCLLGWVRYTDIDSHHELVDRTTSKDYDVALSTLFYTRYSANYNITPEQGAFALRSYLTTGSPNWEEALGLS